MASIATPAPQLFDRIARKAPIHRALDIIILFLLTSLLVYRLLSLKSHGLAWLLALLCESWFTFVWLLTVSTKWSPVEYKTYPERLSQRVEELPSLDMFVTTADPVLESPIIIANTVISLLALDYPADKLACYVSDDGCSPLTYYALVEASKFAKIWVPFCKKYNIQARAPFRYFSNVYMSFGEESMEFQRECKKIKDDYDVLCRRIKGAAEASISWDLFGDLAISTNTERKNHPTIIQVIWANSEHLSDGLPHLIYISREKQPKHPHHYKAGAMNVLTRVSGLITNAPFMLNVDCDMFANNPQIVRHAMCLVLGSKNERECGFVQSPQYFYDGLKDDPFGNQFEVLTEYLLNGFVGIQGPVYTGSGCFHRRKVIYGLCPDDMGNETTNVTPINVYLSENELLKLFGNSKEFVKSVALSLQGKTSNSADHISDLVEAAHEVAGCGYEHGASWGNEIGWQYGSATEDILTGIKIHSRGWRSTYCTRDPPAFFGCAPSGGPTAMTQQKRWATGFIEVLFSRKSPIFATLNAKLQFRQCLAYCWPLLWGLRSIPELCYMILPAYCIITNSTFFPKDQKSALYIYGLLFVVYHSYTLLEYLQKGLSIRNWWNNQRMQKIYSVNARLFALLNALLKILRTSETVFEVTKKDESTSGEDENEIGGFTFDESPIFVPGTTLVLVHFTALLMALLGLQPSVNDAGGSGLGEIICSVLVIIIFWPFVKGLFRKGKYGIPLSTRSKSALLAFVFVNLCKNSSMG